MVLGRFASRSPGILGKIDGIMTLAQYQNLLAYFDLTTE